MIRDGVACETQQSISSNQHRLSKTARSRDYFILLMGRQKRAFGTYAVRHGNTAAHDLNTLLTTALWQPRTRCPPPWRQAAPFPAGRSGRASPSTAAARLATPQSADRRWPLHPCPAARRPETGSRAARGRATYWRSAPARPGVACASRRAAPAAASARGLWPRAAGRRSHAYRESARPRVARDRSRRRPATPGCPAGPRRARRASCRERRGAAAHRRRRRRPTGRWRVPRHTAGSLRSSGPCEAGAPRRRRSRRRSRRPARRRNTRRPPRRSPGGARRRRGRARGRRAAAAARSAAS